MSKKLVYLLILAALFLSLNMSFSVVFSDQALPTQSVQQQQISWQKSIKKSGSTIIPGSVNTSSGPLQFQWVISSKKIAKLVTLEDVGGGSMPKQEKKIFVWVRKDGTTLLLKEWIPQLNENKPANLQEIGSISTKTLFSVLPSKKSPPVAALGSTMQSIGWGKKYKKSSAQYMPGKITVKSGTKSIYWMKKTGRTPELYGLIPRTKYRASYYSRLYLWNSGDYTGLFLEGSPESRYGNTTYLWPYEIVETTQLMSGFLGSQQIDTKTIGD